MNLELDHDLTAWADGSLSREDLVTLHGRAAQSLVMLHERLLGAAEMTPPDAVAGWAILQGKMGTNVVSIRPGQRQRLRRVMLAVAAALLIAGGAFAALREAVVDHPGVLAPTGSPASQDAIQGRSGDKVGGSSGLIDDRSPGPRSSPSAPTGGSGDPTQGSTGSGATGTSGDGADSSGTSGGGIQDSDGQHPGQGNGGEDHGKDGPHGHGGAYSSHA